MIEGIKEDTLRYMFHVQVVKDEPVKPKQQAMVTSGGSSGEPKKPKVKDDKDRIGRNDRCPCGSGKKYKKCCGAA